MSTCRGKLRVDVLMPPDNLSVHTARIAVGEAVNCGFDLLYRFPYSLSFI